jgi:hypothetical protein
MQGNPTGDKQNTYDLQRSWDLAKHGKANEGCRGRQEG